MCEGVFQEVCYKSHRIQWDSFIVEQRLARKLFFKVCKNCKSANSWAPSAIANPQRCANPQIRNTQIFTVNPKTWNSQTNRVERIFFFYTVNDLLPNIYFSLSQFFYKLTPLTLSFLLQVWDLWVPMQFNFLFLFAWSRRDEGASLRGPLLLSIL